MTRECKPPKAEGLKSRKLTTGGKADGSTCHKAVARLNHEVRHERPMSNWGPKGAKR
jgi:hypothetical protein